MGMTMFVIIILFIALLTGIVYGLFKEIYEQLDRIEKKFNWILDKLLNHVEEIKEWEKENE